MTMLRRSVVLTWVALAALPAATPAPAASRADAFPACRPAGRLMRLAGLPEASGLAASLAAPGRLWAHNDSGRPEIFALDERGRVTGRVSVAGAALEDWEAMASARCGGRTCLYIGDIGDNDASRGEIVVYRLPEPETPTGSARVDRVFRASYPDGAHDAEALLAAPDGTLYIVTKDRPALYRLPTETRAGAVLRLERVGPPLSRRRLSGPDRITDGAISPDGEWVVLRTHVALGFYRASAFLNGDFREAGRVDLRPLGEPQGEGVAFGPSNTVYLVGEDGGGGSRSGTLGVLSCAS